MSKARNPPLHLELADTPVLIAFSGVPGSLAPSIVSAVGFSVVMAFATIQLLKNRAWFLWALSSASILQCAGFIASAIYTHDGTNHLAFLASFATITYGLSDSSTGSSLTLY